MMHFSIKNVQVHFSAVCAFRLQRILSERSLGREELEVMDRNRSQIRNARSVRLWSRPSLPIEAGMWTIWSMTPASQAPSKGRSQPGTRVRIPAAAPENESQLHGLAHSQCRRRSFLDREIERLHFHVKVVADSPTAVLESSCLNKGLQTQ